MDKIKINFDERLKELKENIKLMEDINKLSDDFVKAISYLDKREKKETK